jgi:hypothetical protein
MPAFRLPVLTLDTHEVRDGGLHDTNRLAASSCELPGGFSGPQVQVDGVREELQRIALRLGELAGCQLAEERLHAGIRSANRVRRQLQARILSCGTVPVQATGRRAARPQARTMM